MYEIKEHKEHLNRDQTQDLRTSASVPPARGCDLTQDSSVLVEGESCSELSTHSRLWAWSRDVLSPSHRLLESSGLPFTLICTFCQ